MTEQPLVSVVIATYNMRQYLPQAIDSVLAQDYPFTEIIVIDDGSTDGTEEVMELFQGVDNIRYIKTENLGQPKAKNRGLTESNGDYIAFCDADDIWHPHKLFKQLPLFENPAVGVVYSEVSYIDKDGQEIERNIPYERYSGKVTPYLLMKNFVPFGTAVIRKECITKSGIFNETIPMGIDWDLWLRYSLDWEFCYLSERTYSYRIWPGQMSKNLRGRYENAFRILDNFLTLHPSEVTKSSKLVHGLTCM